MKTHDHAPRLRWDDRLGLPHGTIERVVHHSEAWRLAQVGALSVADYWQSVGQALGISSDDLRQLQYDYFSADHLDAGLIAWLRDRRAEGYAVALLSNDSPALRDRLHALAIADLFDPLIISGEVGVMKPDPRAYTLTLQRLACPPGRAVFIDDMPANIAAAQALGIHGIHYTPTLDLPTALAPLLTVEPGADN